MAKRVTIKVEGLKQLEAALREFAPVTSKNIMRRALVAAAQPIADRARQLVPVRSGHLRDSIVVSTKSGSRPGASAYAKALRGGASKADAVAALRKSARGGRSGVEVAVGSGQLPHAHLIEFGTATSAPQPYMRPAWDEGRQKALESIKDHLRLEIDKAAKRAAKRALKPK